MGKSVFEKYQELLDQNILFGNSSMLSNQHTAFDPLDDDSEDFFTSKEIVEMKKHPEKNPGIDLPPGPVDIEEEVVFKSYAKEHKHKYTESEMNAIRESCKCTIVHDFAENDIYHMSDEERAQYDLLNELSKELATIKSRYNQVDKWILAMRSVVKAWEMLQKKGNYIHSEKEFFKLVGKGKIYTSRFTMPKFTKMDKYNKDILIQYISDTSLDPSTLRPVVPKIEDTWYEDIDDDAIETDEEKDFRLLSEDEVRYLLDHDISKPETLDTIEVKDINPKYIRGYDRKVFSRKKKKVSKAKQMTIDGLHQLLNQIEKNPNNRERDPYGYNSYMLTTSMFDQPEKEKDIWDNLFFDGSWASKDDVKLLELATREEMLKQKAIGERYYTNEDMQINAFFRAMEAQGMNVINLRRKMNMSDESLNLEESKKEKKRNKKIESALIQRITELNGNPKFKKLVAKAEKKINEQIEDY